MFRRLFSIFRDRRLRQARRQIIAEFTGKGFAPVPSPSILSLLPLRFPEIVNLTDLALFQKGDMQVLLFPATFLPRTRLPHKPRQFALLSTPLDPSLVAISGAIRDPREPFSLVDQLALDSYPSLSPLPDRVIFAADEKSARQIATIVDAGQLGQEAGSIIVHNGRLLVQLPT